MAKACKNKQTNKALLEEQLKPFINLRAAFGWKKWSGEMKKISKKLIFTIFKQKCFSFFFQVQFYTTISFGLIKTRGQKTKWKVLYLVK